LEFELHPKKKVVPYNPSYDLAMFNEIWSNGKLNFVFYKPDAV
jgi:hypothetical protein